MNRRALVVALVLPLVVLAGEPPSKDVKVTGDPRLPTGVNWNGQLVRATGAGAPNMNASSPAQARLGAEKAALLDAFRNLLAQVKGLQVSSSKTMNSLMENTAVSARVEGIIKTYRVAGKRYFSDNGVEVDVEVPLALFTEVVDPDSVQQTGGLKTEGEKSNTGLVIDARGLKLTPALAPRVLADDGKAVVYSVDTLSLDARRTTAVASYVQNLDEAKKVARVGDKPLVVKALKADGTDVLLAADDTKKLKEINAGFLAEGRVVIVMN